MMLIERWPSYAVCCLWLGVALAYSARSTVALQLAFVLLTLFALPTVVFACIGFAIRNLEALGFKAFVPLFACAVAVVSGFVLAPIARSMYFMSKLSGFETLIAEVKENPPVAGLRPVEIPSDDAELVLVERTVSGALQIEFMTDVGFPVKHAGYLYVERGEVEPGSFMDRRWPQRHQVRLHWFKFSD